jgi:hypothetical protein
MTKRLFSVLFLFAIVSMLMYFYKNDLIPKVQTIRAFGDLKADFGIAPTAPLFHTVSIAAGESEAKSITVANEGPATKLVYIKAQQIAAQRENFTHTELLDIRIEDESNTLYGRGSSTGAKTVKDFFEDSSGKYGIALNAILSGKSKTYFIIVSYSEATGENVLKESLIFDLSIDAINIFDR